MYKELKKEEKFVTHCSKLFDILGTFLADCIGFTVNNKQGVTSKANDINAEKFPVLNKF